MMKFAKGYSLVELIIVVLFIGIFAAIAVPRINFGTISKQQADTIARKIVVDLRRTRALALLDAAGNSSGFALNMTGSSPYNDYEIENLDTSATVDTHSFDSAVGCSGGNNFEFGPLGNLITGSDSSLTVAAEGRSFTITIIPATGAVKCAEN
jgi:prepilin-type N-terminal cleavage/methylation domain-containing protein